MSLEESVEIPGYPGFRIDRSQTVWGLRGRPLRAQTVRGGYLAVGVKRPGGSSREKKPVHQLVLIAFVGPRPAGAITRHLNGNPADNRPENLAWGTALENARDALRHGTTDRGQRHAEAIKAGLPAVTHCKRDHAFTDSNTFIDHRGFRRCRECQRMNRRASDKRRVLVRRTQR